MFKKTLPFCASKYNVVTQVKTVNSILQLVAQCKIYFPFNLKENFAMRNVKKKRNQHRLMSNRIRQPLAYTNCVTSICENIHTKKM